MRVSEQTVASSDTAGRVGSVRGRRRRWGVGVVLAVVAVALVAVGVWRQTASSLAPAPMGHIHGLGVNPGDDTLYAATHLGLYRVPEQAPAQLVSPRTHDLMGFTVLGPNRFLASGHPDGDGDEPAPLGLAESTDGGATWRSRSLGGEADLHAIDVSGSTVYGVDARSGTLLATTDLHRWQQRSRQALADLAVSPTDPQTVIITTEEGLRRSTDGGRSWADMAGPRLLLVDWAAEQTLTGVDPDGAVHVSLDAGRTWQQRATVAGVPEALHAASTARLSVATNAGVHASVDGGWSFAPLGA